MTNRTQKLKDIEIGDFVDFEALDQSGIGYQGTYCQVVDVFRLYGTTKVFGVRIVYPGKPSIDIEAKSITRFYKP
jgi:hypothetical protein